MKPGKKSAAALQVVAPPSISARVEPSTGLSLRECELWREIVKSLPADWVRVRRHPLFLKTIFFLPVVGDLYTEARIWLRGSIEFQRA